MTTQAMKHYKDANNQVWGFAADGSQDHLIGSNLISLDTVAPVRTSAQTKAAQVREIRDRLLRASDWSQLRDVPPATSAAWEPYRQGLRDVTQQSGFPNVVTWPVIPKLES